MPMPKLKLSMKQWKELINRILEREASHISPLKEEAAATEIMKHLPPVETPTEMSRMIDYSSKIGVGKEGAPIYKGVMGPREEMRELYSSAPEQYEIMPPTKDPLVDIYSPTSEHRTWIEQQMQGAETPEDISKLIGYQRAKMTWPIERKTAKETKRVLQEEGALKPEGESSRVLELVQVADSVWTTVIGGMRGVGGQLWGRLYNTAKYKRHYANPKEYFISLYTKYKANPESLKDRDFSREKKFFQTIDTLVEEKGVSEAAKYSMPDVFKGGTLGGAGLGASDIYQKLGGINAIQPNAGTQEVTQ